MFRVPVSSKIDVSKSDQHTIEINMYNKIFFRLCSRRVITKVPSGIEKRIGVSAASPTNPYRCQILTNLLDRGVKIFFLHSVFST